MIHMVKYFLFVFHVSVIKQWITDQLIKQALVHSPLLDAIPGVQNTAMEKRVMVEAITQG